MNLSELSDLSSSDSSTSSSEREPQPKRQRIGALIVPGDPSRRLTTTVDENVAGEAVVARAKPVQIKQWISRAPTKPAQGSAGHVEKEVRIRVKRTAAVSGFKRAMVEATRPDQAERTAPLAKRVSVESSSMSRWIAGLWEAEPPARQADDPRPTLLPRQQANILPAKPRSSLPSNPPPKDAATEALATKERMAEHQMSPDRQQYEEWRKVREQASIANHRLRQHEAMYADSVEEIMWKDGRIRVLEIAGKKKDARIAELEEELRKRKAESERGAKKKFRFSIEVEVDGQAIEGIVANAEE